ALSYSLFRAETGMLGPLQGWLIQVLGLRSVMLAGCLLLAAGLWSLGQTTQVQWFWISLAIIAVGASMTGILSLMSVLVNWFDRRRATALANMQAGMSLGGLMVPLHAMAIVSFGWREVATASAVLTL